jgi:hypothetical protein
MAAAPIVTPTAIGHQGRAARGFGTSLARPCDS